MSTAAGRIRAFFFDSPAGERAHAVATRAPVYAERVAVLGRVGGVESTGAAVALRSANDLGAPCALLARWQVRGRGWRLPPTRTAARTAGVLRARGLRATASGRLVRLDLSPEAPAAGAELARAAAVVAGPVVLVTGIARNEAVDRVLLEHDELVLVSDEENLTDRLAAESLAALGLPLRIMRPLGRGGLLAAAGLAGASVPLSSGASR